jgi:hypothetical protein
MTRQHSAAGQGERRAGRYPCRRAHQVRTATSIASHPRAPCTTAQAGLCLLAVSSATSGAVVPYGAAERSAVRPAFITGYERPPGPVLGVVLFPFEAVHVVTQQDE